MLHTNIGWLVPEKKIFAVRNERGDFTGVLEGLQTKVATLEKENQDLRDRVEKLEAKADAAEQYSRRNCLRITGVPEDKAADTDRYVLDLSRAIGEEIVLTDIERSHHAGNLQLAGQETS